MAMKHEHVIHETWACTIKHTHVFVSEMHLVVHSILGCHQHEMPNTALTLMTAKYAMHNQMHF